MTPITRRGFLKRIGAVAVTTAAGPTILDVFIPMGQAAKAATPLPVTGNLPTGMPIVVVIDLQGGNDFLNMLVPVNDPWYYDPTYGHGSLAIAPNAAKPLAGTPYGVHPSLNWLSQRWAKGDLAFVLGTGENVVHEFSHFAAMQYRNAADFSANAFGWLGRYNDVVAANSPYASVSTDGLHPMLLASTVPILQVRDCANMAFSSDYRYRTGFQPAIAAMGNNGPTDASMIGRSAANHRNVLMAMNRVTQASKPSYNGGASSSVQHQLAQAAMLIDAGVPSQTYVVTTNGYDTHGSQSWVHGDLLSQLDTGLSWFFGIIDGTSRANDVFVMITSEFGRQVTQNASGGVDHGQGGGMVVLGGGVKGGLYGQQPTLNPGGPTRPNRINDALVPTVDFRDVYATVLNRLGKDPALTAEVLEGTFPDLGIFSAAPPPPPGSTTTTVVPPPTSTSTTMPETTTTMPPTTTSTMPPTTTSTMPPNTTSTTMAPSGAVLNIKAPGVVFDPAKTTYVVPVTGDRVAVTVWLAKTTDLLYIDSNPVKSGVEYKAWMGRGKVDIVVYRNWKEVARYTLVAG